MNRGPIRNSTFNPMHPESAAPAAFPWRLRGIMLG